MSNNIPEYYWTSPDIYSINIHPCLLNDSIVPRTPACNIYVPKPNISLSKISFANDAAHAFNSLPLSANASSMKRDLKGLYSNISFLMQSLN